MAVKRSAAGPSSSSSAAAAASSPTTPSAPPPPQSSSSPATTTPMTATSSSSTPLYSSGGPGQGSGRRLSVEVQVALLSTLLESPCAYRPVGPGRHFHVAVAMEELQRAGFGDVAAADVWQFLRDNYDLEGLEALHAEKADTGEDGDLLHFTDFTLPKAVLNPTSSSSAAEPSSSKPQEAEKPTSGGTGKSGAKRPTRSAPSSAGGTAAGVAAAAAAGGATPGKRRK